jgi:hypothetical protein
MTINHLLPPPSKDFNEAKRMYMEQFGSALVTNTYLKIALLSVSVIAVGLLVLNIKTYQIFYYYSRVRATVRNNFARSLYFLDGRAADALIEQKKKSKEIEMFLVTGSQETEVVVTNVAIEDMRTPPYHATVDFEKVYYSIPEHIEMRRERFVGNYFFVIKDQVPNAIVPINPLGLAITYFREDQAFPEQGK